MTSVTLENSFWEGLQAIARDEDIPVSRLIEQIDTERTRHNLSSATRLFVLEYYRSSGQPDVTSSLNERREAPLNGP